MVHRYYDPGTGQFLTVDPLVSQTGQAYAYAGGDPVNGSDPSGLSPPPRACLKYLSSGPVGPVDQNTAYEQCVENAIGTGPGEASGPSGWDSCRQSYSWWTCAVMLGDPLSPAASQFVDAYEESQDPCAGNWAIFGHVVAGIGLTAPFVLPVFGAAEEGAGDAAFHYTASDAVDSIMENGLRPGSYVTTEGDLSPEEAQVRLALNPAAGERGALIQIDLSGLRAAGYDVPEVTRVASAYGMPGGGWEMQFPYEIPPQLLEVIRP